MKSLQKKQKTTHEDEACKKQSEKFEIQTKAIIYESLKIHEHVSRRYRF